MVRNRKLLEHPAIDRLDPEGADGVATAHDMVDAVMLDIVAEGAILIDIGFIGGVIAQRLKYRAFRGCF